MIQLLRSVIKKFRIDYPEFRYVNALPIKDFCYQAQLGGSIPEDGDMIVVTGTGLGNLVDCGVVYGVKGDVFYLRPPNGLDAMSKAIDQGKQPH